MTAWDWIRVGAGLAGLCLTYAEHKKRPDRKVWVLGLIASIGFIAAGIFHI